MNWIEKAPTLGDVIRTKVSFYYHYGIYVNDDRVIQFGLPHNVTQKASDVFVLESDIRFFLGEGELEVGVPSKTERSQMRSPEIIVETAESMIGNGGYDILHNNCEHFVYFCAFGENRSCFLDNLRLQLKKKLGG